MSNFEQARDIMQTVHGTKDDDCLVVEAGHADAEHRLGVVESVVNHRRRIVVWCECGLLAVGSGLACDEALLVAEAHRVGLLEQLRELRAL